MKNVELEIKYNADGWKFSEVIEYVTKNNMWENIIKQLKEAEEDDDGNTECDI